MSKNYEISIKCYKKLLQLSWITRSKEAELHAYEMIGLNYYYLGDLKRAKNYSKKFLNGDCQAENSYTITILGREFEKKTKEKDIMFGVPSINLLFDKVETLGHKILD